MSHGRSAAAASGEAVTALPGGSRISRDLVGSRGFSRDLAGSRSGGMRSMWPQPTRPRPLAAGRWVRSVAQATRQQSAVVAAAGPWRAEPQGAGPAPEAAGILYSPPLSTPQSFPPNSSSPKLGTRLSFSPRPDPTSNLTAHLPDPPWQCPQLEVPPAPCSQWSRHISTPLEHCRS